MQRGRRATADSLPQRHDATQPQNRPWTRDVNIAMLLHMKRTTLLLDASLHGELKRRAADEGRTLTEVVERALRAGLDAHAPARRPRVHLPSYDLGPFLADPALREVRARTDGER